MKFSSETETAMRAAEKAGERILKIYNTRFDTEFKSDEEPVTLADTESEKIIIEALTATSIPVLSEERGDDLKRLRSSKVWIVDPLDGTSDFVRRTGEFAVMIGLAVDHTPTVGVIYQPIGDILYVAEKGQGAYMRADGHWSKLSVSSVSEALDARAIMSKHHFSTEDKQVLDQLGVHSYVRHGSAGLKAAAIARGEAELYFTFTDKIKQWDTCAAYSIVTEAGGKITDTRGQALVYNTKNVNHEHGILVSNGHFADLPFPNKS